MNFYPIFRPLAFRLDAERAHRATIAALRWVPPHRPPDMPASLRTQVAGLEFHSPAFKVDVKCTCGCGDCFNGGFASGLIKGLSPRDAVELGQASSALNATGLGSQAGVRDYDATRTFIKRTSRRGLGYDISDLERA